MSLLAEIMEANRSYSYVHRGAGLTSIPSRRLAILTCMDSRLDPAKFAGLREGEAHVIRNAGGRATDDAIRSLVVSHKLLGTNVWLVIHHTDCGMELPGDSVIADLLNESLETAVQTEGGWRNAASGGGSPEGRFIKWHTIQGMEQSVRDDVHRIKAHPLVSRAIEVHGLLFDVRTGRLTPVG